MKNISENKKVKRLLISRRDFDSLIIAVKVIKRITSSSHDAVEFIEIEHSIAISVSFFKHFFQFFIWNFLTDFAGDSFQIFESDFIKVIFVKKFEDFVDFVFRISWTHSGSHDSYELIVTDSLLDILAHFRVNISDVLFFDFHSESFHDCFEFSGIDLSYIINWNFYLYFCYRIF